MEEGDSEAAVTSQGCTWLWDVTVVGIQPLPRVKEEQSQKASW